MSKALRKLMEGKHVSRAKLSEMTGIPLSRLHTRLSSQHAWASRDIYLIGMALGITPQDYHYYFRGFSSPGKDTLCWRCANAVPTEDTGCLWSREFKPVEGWDAEETSVLAKNKSGARHLVSYRVKSCPGFEEG